MTQPTDAHLLASIAGTLDAGRELELSEQLATRPERMARRARLAAELDPPVQPGVWSLPPVGAWGHAQASRIQIEPMLSMDAGALIRPGARLRIALPTEEAPEGAELVVLWRGTGAWERVLPTPGLGSLPMSALTRDGQTTVQVVVQPAAARQWWAVVVLPPGAVADWFADEALISVAVQQALADRSAAASVVAWDVTLPET